MAFSFAGMANEGINKEQIKGKKSETGNENSIRLDLKEYG